MKDRSITLCGFPESGKTTYLAALWHLLTDRAQHTCLRFQSLRNGDHSHLNALAKRWRDGLTQIRTETRSSKLVSMNLLDASNLPFRLTVPDLSGESYRAMYEERECDTSIADILMRAEGMLFCIHADRIRQPHLVVDVMSQSRAIGSTIPDGQVATWTPSLAPTQVQVVELLQLFCLPPLRVDFRRIAIVLSAWDKVVQEGRTPKQFLAERLPLVDQYLCCQDDAWVWRVYGVSAQGADYEKGTKQLSAEDLKRLEQLRALDDPSMRISVVTEESESHDLSEPIAWLLD